MLHSKPFAKGNASILQYSLGEGQPNQASMLAAGDPAGMEGLQSYKETKTSEIVAEIAQSYASSPYEASVGWDVATEIIWVRYRRAGVH